MDGSFQIQLVIKLFFWCLCVKDFSYWWPRQSAMVTIISQLPDFSLDQDSFPPLHVPISQSKVPTQNFAQKYNSPFNIFDNFNKISSNKTSNKNLKTILFKAMIQINRIPKKHMAHL